MKTLRRTMIPAALIPGALAVLLLAAACNTIQGAGRDVQSVGDTIQDVAD